MQFEDGPQLPLTTRRTVLAGVGVVMCVVQWVAAVVLAPATTGANANGAALGAAGAVSGLASCFPDVVVPLVRDRTSEAQEKATALRASLQRLPFHAAAKTVLGLRGVPIAAEVRAPLRGLTDAERVEVERIVEELG